jgi:hypothetical protein
MKPKTNKPTAVKNENMVAGQTSFQITSLSEITNSFIKEQAAKDKKSDGVNDCVRDFATIARFISENQTSFCFNDFLALSRSLDSSPDLLAPMFYEWVEALKSHKRLSITQGCYDWQTYVFR